MKNLIIIFYFIFLMNASNGLLISQCNEVNSGVTSSLTCISRSNFESDIYICGDNSVVIRSSNFGTSWSTVSSGIPPAVSLKSIHTIPNFPLIAVICFNRNDSSFVYRTTNGGGNWSQVFYQPGGKINGFVSNDATGRTYMFGDPVANRWSIWKSSNQGLNWDSSGMLLQRMGSETGRENGIFYYRAGMVGDSSYMFIGTNNSKIYFSSNHGDSWSSTTTAGETEPYTMYFYEYGNGYRGYCAGLTKILYTSNSGISWDSLSVLPGSGRITWISATSPPVNSFGDRILYFIRNDNKIYAIQYSSTNWHTVYTALSGTYTTGNGRCTNIAVRNNGGISLCGCPVGIININSTLPTEYSLSQNYPNPFNPLTNIKFDLPNSGFVKMIIYDILGREISQLVNQQMQAGSYSVDWDASNYPSGVYFYKMIVGDNTNNGEAGDFSETKKMVLVK